MVGHARRNVHEAASLDHARLVADPHRQRSLEHIEHVVQTLVAMRRRARRAPVRTSSLRERTNPVDRTRSGERLRD
jgi:hypothetical protein